MATNGKKIERKSDGGRHILHHNQQRQRQHTPLESSSYKRDIDRSKAMHIVLLTTTMATTTSQRRQCSTCTTSSTNVLDRTVCSCCTSKQKMYNVSNNSLASRTVSLQNRRSRLGFYFLFNMYFYHIKDYCTRQYIYIYTCSPQNVVGNICHRFSSLR